MLRLLKALLIGSLLVALAGGAGLWWALQQPLPLAGGSTVDVDIPPGTGARGVAQRISDAGVQVPAWLLFAGLRLSGQSRDVKAGFYAVEPGTTAPALLGKLVRGEQSLISVTLIEGWTARQVLQALANTPELRDDLSVRNPAQATDAAMAEVMALIGRPGVHPEGRFFPDTYRVARRSPASGVLVAAARAMDERLAEVWAARDPSVPLKSPEEALILASIVEKETGLEADRGRIAGVFANRLRIGMRLQTDPTVIYGLGVRFDGNLRRRDLDTDTPYNTYTRAGLPPTPIAMPGLASLRAAVRPEATDALYFVARGDGSSQFSATLDAHNAAVRRYILQR